MAQRNLLKSMQMTDLSGILITSHSVQKCSIEHSFKCAMLDGLKTQKQSLLEEHCLNPVKQA